MRLSSTLYTTQWMSIRERVLRTGILQSTLMCQYAQTRALSGRVKEKPLDPSLSTYCTCICVVHARHNLDCGTKRSATQLDEGFGGFTLPYQGSLLCSPYSVHPSMHIMTHEHSLCYCTSGPTATGIRSSRSSAWPARLEPPACRK